MLKLIVTNSLESLIFMFCMRNIIFIYNNTWLQNALPLYCILYLEVFFSVEQLTCMVLQWVQVLERLQDTSYKCNLDTWTANPINAVRKKTIFSCFGNHVIHIWIYWFNHFNKIKICCMFWSFLSRIKRVHNGIMVLNKYNLDDDLNIISSSQ